VKKLTFVAALVVVAGLAAGTASAGLIPLPNNTNLQAKLMDFGAWYNAGVPVPVGVPPAVGFEDRSIFQVTQLNLLAGGVPVWPTASPPKEELTGVFYDLKIGAFSVIGPPGPGQVVLIDYIPMGRIDPSRPDLKGAPVAGAGGAFDVWLDQTLDYGITAGVGAPFLGPGAWVPNCACPGDGIVGLHDDYPGAGNLNQLGVAEGNVAWLYGDFVPLATAPLLPGVAVMTQTIFPFSGFGFGTAFLNIKGGSVADVLGENGFGPGMDVSLIYDVKFTPNPAAPPLYGWSVRSNDPVTFSTVPEPCTMLLLGSCVLGAFGYLKRRRA
jgi:hypothetical protein